jgi:asparaginyl-tRNA synthetase
MWMQIKKLLGQAEADQPVTVHGWVKSRRSSKAVGFIMLNDGSQQDDLQLVVDQSVAAFAKLNDIQTGSAIKGQGKWVASPGRGQNWEIHLQEIEIVGDADPTKYPLQKKGHTLEFLREIAHLRGRTNTFGAVFRVRNRIAWLVHRFFQERGFLWAHTPIITANDCEGAGELFTVTTFDVDRPARDDKGKIDYTQDFFGKRAHLTVSGQLEGEIMAQAFGKIYTFGPTFRAENSNTTRHLSEFWMIEPEIAFANLNDDCDLAEDFLRYIFRHTAEDCAAELAFLNKHYEQQTSAEFLIELAHKPLTRIDYTDAIAELEKAKVKFEFPVRWGMDMQSEHERYLTDTVFKGLVAVFNYPKDIKAFYMRDNDDAKTVAAMDVLAPRIGEIIGGSQREERLDVLTGKMQAQGVATEDIQWYLDLRRFGSTPHAGFGVGFERLVQYATGMTNIRDVVPFPRAPKTIAF